VVSSAITKVDIRAAWTAFNSRPVNVNESAFGRMLESEKGCISLYPLSARYYKIVLIIFYIVTKISALLFGSKEETRYLTVNCTIKRSFCE